MTHSILFIAAFETPFIRKDLEFLRSRYRVTALIGHGPMQVLRILLAVPRCDVVFCWFASVYASIAVLAGRLFFKRTLIQLGGVDMAKEDRLGYGIWTNRWKSAIVRRGIRNAHTILAVDQSLMEEARTRGEYDGRNLVYLPTGYDSEVWSPLGSKLNQVLCVAAAPDEPRVFIKGVDIFLEAARRLPDISFLLIGVGQEIIATLRGFPNVKAYGWVEQVEVIKYMRASRVYCQPSRREGLANALCEAMLCECIPVATAVGGNPRAIGNAGLLVPPNDAEALTIALKTALGLSDDYGRMARQHIIKQFPNSRRENGVVQHIEGRAT